jgi:hypothetical protein
MEVPPAFQCPVARRNTSDGEDGLRFLDLTGAIEGSLDVGHDVFAA